MSHCHSKKPLIIVLTILPPFQYCISSLWPSWGKLYGCCVVWLPKNFNTKKTKYLNDIWFLVILMEFYKNKEVCCNRISLKYFKAERLHFFKSTERMAKQMLNKNNTTEGITHSFDVVVKWRNDYPLQWRYWWKTKCNFYSAFSSNLKKKYLEPK